MSSQLCGEISYPFLNFNGCTVEVQEWVSNFTPHFMMDVITYSYWDWSLTMLVKGAIASLEMPNYKTHIWKAVKG